MGEDGREKLFGVRGGAEGECESVCGECESVRNKGQKKKTFS